MRPTADADSGGASSCGGVELHHSRRLCFLKLGGSLITDKRAEETARHEVIRRAAEEVRAALDEEPALQLLLGHGSGSFGHFAARRSGFHGDDRPNWRAYAETGAAAARLNRLVTEAFLDAGVPVVSVQPSASAFCRDGRLTHLEVPVLREILGRGLIPLVYGDVALDEIRGYTITSTEQIFAYLARQLAPKRVILAGRVDGVFTADPQREPAAKRIPHVTEDNVDEVKDLLGGSAGVDVTGGMAAKVEIMWQLVETIPGLEVFLISGEREGAIRAALVGDDPGGTTLGPRSGERNVPQPRRNE